MNNTEGAVALFSEMKQTGLPMPCVLYQEVFLALHAGGRFFQVENMYQEMRRDGVQPDLSCFLVRLQTLISTIDRAHEKGEMIFWLDKKLRDIQEEIGELNLPISPRIYGSLLLLACRGNEVEMLVSLWEKYCQLFPDEAPHARAITNTITAVSERFEDAAAAYKILVEAQQRYGYSIHSSLLSTLCFRALDTADSATALALFPLIQNKSMKLYRSAMRCATQTQNRELADLAWPVIQKQAPALAQQLFFWQLYLVAKTDDCHRLIDELCNASSETRETVQQHHWQQITPHLFDSTEQIDDAYYYCEQKGSDVCIEALDMIITACGIMQDPIRAIETYQALEDFGLTPKVSTYNAMMNVYLMNEDYEIVSKVFSEIQNASLKPDSVSYEYLARSYLCRGEAALLLESIADSTEDGIILPYSVYDDSIRFFVDEGNTTGPQFIIDRMKALHVDVSVVQQYVNSAPIKFHW